MAGDPRLSHAARRVITVVAEVVVRAASDRRIATKHRLGRLRQADAPASNIRACIADQDFQVNRTGFPGELISWEDGFHGKTESAFTGRTGAGGSDGTGARI